jgi:hypothetical protein
MNLLSFFLPSRCCSLIFHFSVLPEIFSLTQLTNSVQLYVTRFEFLHLESLRQLFHLHCRDISTAICASGVWPHQTRPRPATLSGLFFTLCSRSQPPTVVPLLRCGPTSLINIIHFPPLFLPPRPNSCNFVQGVGIASSRVPVIIHILCAPVRAFQRFRCWHFSPSLPFAALL